MSPASTTSTPRSSSSLDYTKPAFNFSTTSLTSTACSTRTKLAPGSKAAKSLWAALKKHIREHHESVNAVYAHLYGHGYGRKVVLGKKERWTAEGKGPEL
ncbi:hypothetical protein B5807_07696 [Epicoccum nigrum]|uniref:Uncharacterized protein n=1 Tax=Epicoccum nigrum TaxID=105696 RepID=A0A1Y2LXH7_EPING|nr:hypothetical protein B5807_07696 [Epicoccum nigrum]